MLFQLKDIYKKLRRDYNGDILEEYKDENIKNLFKKVSTELKEKNKVDTPLVNIVYNHFNGVLPSPDYVSGPMSLSYQTSDEYDMKIYIFGEAHGEEKTCDKLEFARSSNMDISIYLQQLFLNSDKFIDFYLEDQMFSPAIYDDKWSIFKLRFDFNNCLHPDKRKDCIFKTVRSHFVDTRHIYENDILYRTFEMGLLIDNLKNNPENTRLRDIDTMKRLSKAKSYKEISIIMVAEALSSGIIKKELEKSDLGEELIALTLARILPSIYKTFFTMKEWKEIFAFDGIHPNTIGILKVITGLFVDIYTVARMFKTFKKGHNFPQKPKYIIYYAGDLHSETVRKFLEKLGFKMKFYTGTDLVKSTRCLNISGIDLDFK